MPPLISRSVNIVGTKGKASHLLERRIKQVSRHFAKLTVRQLFYLLISRHMYSASRQFYKRLDYILTKLRRSDHLLHAKFVDPTRVFVQAPMAYRRIELWVEKDSLRNFLEHSAAKHRMSIQVLKGFASITMYRIALLRAEKRNVKKILYVGDFDPSGLLIEEIAKREMGVEVERVALTSEQIKRYKLPWLPVKRKDSRANHYIEMHGDKSWEVEALGPKNLMQVVEQKLQENIPLDYLVRTKAKEQASKIARPIIKKLAGTIEKEVRRLMDAGEPEKDIIRKLASRYHLRFGR